MVLKVPCLLDDSTWIYGPGMFTQEISRTTKLCPEASEREKVIYKGRASGVRQKSYEEKYHTITAVPKDVEQKLRSCHEDIQLWYVGVIMEYILQHTTELEDKLQTIISERTDLSFSTQFLAIHMRSTDKKSEATILEPKVYARC